jgi:hypothetical protein
MVSQKGVRQLVIILSQGADTALTTVIRDTYVELAAKWIKLAEEAMYQTP